MFRLRKLTLAFLLGSMLSLAPDARATNWLSCDAGGPYVVSPSNGPVTVQLDGTDSHGESTYHWKTSCPSAFFDDATSPTPLLTIPAGACSTTINVTLTVTGNGQCKSCCTTVKIKDTTPPVIECPETAKFFCGESTHPNATGYPVVSDNADPSPKLTWSDKIVKQACEAERFDHVIERTWKAKDKTGNVSKCVQIIDVLKNLVALDVLPGECPNDLRRGECGWLPVTVLGSATFDVKKVQWSSIKLYGEHCDGGPVKPFLTPIYCDVASPFFEQGGAECECIDTNGDGFLDITFFFKQSQIESKLGLCDYEVGDVIRIVVVGKSNCPDCKFIGTDCIRIAK